MPTHTTPLCPICEEPSVYFSKKRDWQIYCCVLCDHYHVFPCPTDKDLAKIYSSDSGYGLGREGDLSKTKPSSAQKLNDLLVPLVGNCRRVLDVGCGDGRLLYHMRNLGWDVAGTEYSDAYIAVARKHGLDVRNATLADAGFGSGTFGAATLGDVIEHSVSPRALLQSLRGLLTADGILVIRTPNAGCGYSRLSGTLARLTSTQWLASEAPLHVNDFTAHSLTKLVKRCAFKVLSCQSNGKRRFSYAIGSSGYLDSIKRRAKRLTGLRRALYILSASTVIAPVALLTAVPFILGRALDLRNQEGDYLTLIARRE